MIAAGANPHNAPLAALLPDQFNDLVAAVMTFVVREFRLGHVAQGEGHRAAGQRGLPRHRDRRQQRPPLLVTGHMVIMPSVSA